MTHYAVQSDCEVTGVEYNRKMLEITKDKLASRGIYADFIQGNVERPPFLDSSFDTIINTMALTEYSDGDRALGEMERVLNPSGKLLILDFDYPKDRNIFGYYFVKIWEKLGDIIKDINSLLREHNFDYTDTPVGGFGSVHLFVCTNKK